MSVCPSHFLIVVAYLRSLVKLVILSRKVLGIGCWVNRIREGGWKGGREGGKEGGSSE